MRRECHRRLASRYSLDVRRIEAGRQPGPWKSSAIGQPFVSWRLCKFPFLAGNPLVACFTPGVEGAAVEPADPASCVVCIALGVVAFGLGVSEERVKLSTSSLRRVPLGQSRI